MANPESNWAPKLRPSAERMVRQVESRQASALRAERHRKDVWAPIAILGFVGWSVVVPTLAGAALGAWIDHRWPDRYSWTLMLLIAGLALGCLNVWMRIRRDQP